MSALLSHTLDIGRHSVKPSLRSIRTLSDITQRELQFLRGELIDVSLIACWVGLRIPTAFTSDVWTACFGHLDGRVCASHVLKHEEQIWQIVRCVQDTLRRFAGAKRSCTVDLVDETRFKVLRVTLSIRLSVGDFGETVLTMSDPIVSDA